MTEKQTDAEPEKTSEGENKTESVQESTLEQLEASVAKESAPKISTQQRKSQKKVSRHTRASSADAKAKTTRIWPLVLLNLLMLGALGGAMYYGWDKWSSFTEQQNLQRQAETSQLQDTIQASQNAALSAIQGQVTELLAKIEEQAQQIDLQKSQIVQLSGAKTEQWSIAEIEFVLQMAGRKLWLEKDVTTSKALLTQADEQLANLQDPSLVPLRSAIADDLLALDTVELVDKEQIALRILSLMKATEEFAFIEPETYFNQDQVEVSESIDDWRSNLWQSFKENVITIERLDTPIEPFISKQQQLLKRSELNIHLLVAQQALLSEQDELFKESLQAARASILLFNSEKASVQSSLQAIDQLIAMDVSPELPKSLQAMEAFRQYKFGASANAPETAEQELQ